MLGTVTLPSTTAIGDVSATELQYLSTVTSNVQTQLDAKLNSSTATSTYAPLTAANLVRPVLTSAFETVDVVGTAPGSSYNFDISTAAVDYITANNTGNFSINFREVQL